MGGGNSFLSFFLSVPDACVAGCLLRTQHNGQRSVARNSPATGFGLSVFELDRIGRTAGRGGEGRGATRCRSKQLLQAKRRFTDGGVFRGLIFSNLTRSLALLVLPLSSSRLVSAMERKARTPRALPSLPTTHITPQSHINCSSLFCDFFSLFLCATPGVDAADDQVQVPQRPPRGQALSHGGPLVRATDDSAGAYVRRSESAWSS